MAGEAWQAALTALVERGYGRGPATLRSIAHYTFADRVICRAEFANGPPGLLRAFTGDVRGWLLGQAVALAHVEAGGFPAPRVIRTADGEPLATDGEWTALLLTYVEGVEADYAPTTLEALGELAAALHSLPGEPAGASRLAPDADLLGRLPEVEACTGRAAYVARPLHETAVTTLRRLAAAGPLPRAMLHGDCWPANAVRTAAGGLVLVDWEGAGGGPAVLELGYLLLACHMGRPQLPAMRADPELIGAVVRGYARGRQPDDDELRWLPEAVSCDIVRRAVEIGAFAAGEERWHDDVWLRKLVARHAISAEVAEIASRCFLAERG